MGGPRDAQRKAWNEAMKSAAGASALPSSLKQPSNRRSDRRKKQARREKAKVTSNVSSDDAEYRAAVWMDTLEGVVDGAVEQDADDEYDELDELDSGAGGKRKRGARKSTKKAGVLPKRFKSRTLASILVEEAHYECGVAREFINAEATLPPNQQLPPRKFCPVTGLFGIYTDQKTGIPFANLKALEQIQERAPPWMNLSGTAAYLEATKSLSDK